MAEYELTTKQYGKVTVRIPTVPSDPIKLRDALADEIRAGRYTPVPDAPEKQGMLARLSTSYRTNIAEPATGVLQDVIEAPARAFVGARQTPEGKWATAQGEVLSDSPIAGFLARGIVPQNLTELGVLAGTAGAGGVVAKAGLTGFQAALTRVLGASAGGLAGGSTEDNAGMGLLQGLAQGTLGEAAGVVIDRLMKMGSSRISRIIQAAAADDVGTKMGGIPELRSFVVENGQIVGRGENVFSGRNTPAALRDLVMGDKRTNGKMLLGQEQDKINEAIEGLLPQTGVAATIEGRNWQAPGYLFKDPQDPHRYIPWKEVRKTLAKMFDSAYGGAKQANPLTSTAKGIDPKEAHRAAVEGIRSQLDAKDPTGQAIALFDAGQEQFRVGYNLLKSLRPGFNDFASDRVVFDFGAIQRVYSKKQAQLVESLKPHNYDTMVQAIFPGGRPGLADEPLRPTPTIGLFAGGITSPHAYASHLERFLGGPKVVGNRLDMGQAARTGITLGTEAITGPIAEKLQQP